jgi:hypothetical protein
LFEFIDDVFLLAVDHVILSIYHVKTNRTFAYAILSLINCSNFLSCSSCTNYAEHCLWNLQTVQCQDKTSSMIQRKRLIMHSSQCPRMYLEHAVNRLALNTNHTLTIHFEQCNQLFDVAHCQLTDYRKRLLFISTSVIVLNNLPHINDICLVKCSFSLMNVDHWQTITFHRALNMDLSIQFVNETSLSLSRTHISFYDCERLALNCTSCLQIDSSFNCIWCNNRCSLKNEATIAHRKCAHVRECLLPVIHTVEPLLLPIHGGTIVTITGKHFDLFNLTIVLADIPCRLIEDESSSDKYVSCSTKKPTSPLFCFIRTCQCIYK